MESEWEERQSSWKPNTEEDARSPFEIDYARIIHSASFRRLQGKTQVFNLGDCDFYRTRLTHSLEVAQIATGIVRRLAQCIETKQSVKDILPDVSLIQTIGLAHDLGHPPFGHSGEIALNYCMRMNGGFEGNGQTLRILTRLEKFTENNGADLTRRSLLGILKYPITYSNSHNDIIKPTAKVDPTSLFIIDKTSSTPPKCIFDENGKDIDWILEPMRANDKVKFKDKLYNPNRHSQSIFKSFDCSIMDIADDISNGVHDLEDAIYLKLINENDLSFFLGEANLSGFLKYLKLCGGYEVCSGSLEKFIGNLFRHSCSRKLAVGQLVGYFVNETFADEIEGFDEIRIKWQVKLSPSADYLIKLLKEIVDKLVIKDPRIQQMEFKGQQLVVNVFEAIESDPKALMPADNEDDIDEDRGGISRRICDYIAGMTDAHLLKTYERLFSPRMGSIFDKL